MSYHTCYKCSRGNPDFEWTSLCAACRALVTETHPKTFLDRLIPADAVLMREMGICVESDMLEAIGRR